MLGWVAVPAGFGCVGAGEVATSGPGAFAALLLARLKVGKGVGGAVGGLEMGWTVVSRPFAFWPGWGRAMAGKLLAWVLVEMRDRRRTQIRRVRHIGGIRECREHFFRTARLSLSIRTINSSAFLDAKLTPASVGDSIYPPQSAASAHPAARLRPPPSPRTA